MCAEWIRPDLTEATRQLLRQELEKTVSKSDEPGFIYAYILDEGPTAQYKNPNTTLYKIGRTTNLNRRMNQWMQKCGVVPRLIEFFPTPPTSLQPQPQPQLDERRSPLHQDLFLSPSDAPKVKLSHRVERLIHLELRDRHRAEVAACKGCGEIHREWFRVGKGDNEAGNQNGWLELRQVIVRWVYYVEAFYGIS